LKKEQKQIRKRTDSSDNKHKKQSSHFLKLITRNNEKIKELKKQILYFAIIEQAIKESETQKKIESVRKFSP